MLRHCLGQNVAIWLVYDTFSLLIEVLVELWWDSSILGRIQLFGIGFLVFGSPDVGSALAAIVRVYAHTFPSILVLMLVTWTVGCDLRALKLWLTAALSSLKSILADDSQVTIPGCKSHDVTDLPFASSAHIVLPVCMVTQQLSPI